MGNDHASQENSTASGFVDIMDRHLQAKKLDTARTKCLNSLTSWIKSDPKNCDSVWDEVLCWGESPPNTIQSQRCPNYIHGFDTHQNATRYCDANGSWFVHPDLNVSWTNYYTCVHHSATDNQTSLTKRAMKEAMEHAARLNLISSIGYGVSLFSLVIAVIIICCSRKLKSKTNLLHLNLFLAFILRACLSFIVRLLFVDGLGLKKDLIKSEDGRYIFNKEGSHWECRLLQTVFLYAICVSQMWIFVEGLYLHMLIYKTLNTDRSGVKLYTILGWVLPCIILVPWVIVKYMTDNTYCWNYSSEHSYIWIINGPMMVTVILNFVFFLNISRVLCSRVRSGERHMGSAYRRLAKFILVLVPLFGVFYILLNLVFPLGYATRFNFLQMYVEMAYNSFQGFILALLFCFLNEEVLNAVKRLWTRRASRRESAVATRSFVLSSFRRTSRQSRGPSIVNPIYSHPSLTPEDVIRPNWFVRLKRRAASCFGQDAWSKNQKTHVSSSGDSSKTKTDFDVSTYKMVDDE